FKELGGKLPHSTRGPRRWRDKIGLGAYAANRRYKNFFSCFRGNQTRKDIRLLMENGELPLYRFKRFLPEPPRTHFDNSLAGPYTKTTVNQFKKNFKVGDILESPWHYAIKILFI